ncbi:UNVERIFIED_CONTAM: putative peroxiredoxin [Streptomyces canus]
MRVSQETAGQGPELWCRPITIRTRRPTNTDQAPAVKTIIATTWRTHYAADMAKKLVIKVTAGADAPERCSQAFTVAAVAVASGVDVSLWLTGESAWFALPGRAAEFELPHAAPLPDLLDSILTGGRLTLCTQCAARRDITEKDVIEGVRIAGAQVFVQEALAEETQALVY